jgi:hypothetical protein
MEIPDYLLVTCKYFSPDIGQPSIKKRKGKVIVVLVVRYILVSN